MVNKMPTAKVKIPPTQAQMIGLIHQALSAAREYARNLASDKELHQRVRPFFTDQAASLTLLLNRMDSRVPKEIYDMYKEQVIEADSLQLDNIRQLFIRMLPEQRDMLERAAEGILKGEVEVRER